jgi:transposase
MAYNYKNPPLNYPKICVNWGCGRFLGSQTSNPKSINGLIVVVQENFSLDPFAQALFVFCNWNRNRLKIPEWDGDGFWLTSLGKAKNMSMWEAVWEWPL